MSQASTPPAATSSGPPAKVSSWQRLADVRPGEGVLVAGACVVLAGIVGAHVLLETARDALFLTKLEPSSLAFVYVAMAVLGLLMARADQMISRALGRNNALVLALMVAATGTMVFFSSSLGKGGAFALYLWAGVISALLTVQFWLAAAQRFTPGQGRRLYGLLSAGGVLGAVLGGALGALLAEWLSVRSLLAAAAVLHLVTAWVVTAAPRATEAALPEPRYQMRAELQTVRSNAYLLRVGLLLQVAGAAVLLVDYLFKTTMAARLAPHELGVFFARYYAIMNGVALVVQVFITMQVLQRMGTILALTLMPIAVLLSGAGGLAVSSFALGVLLAKGTDGALRFSLHRVSTELLFLPLSPRERSRAKPFFDSVLARITQALVATAILVLGRMHWLSPAGLALAAAALCLIWIGLAWSLRRPYLDRFRLSLGGPARQRSFELLQLNLDSVAVLVEALSSPDETRVISAMGLFHEGERDNLIPALVLYHPSPRVLTRALEVLPRPGRQDWVPLAERLLQHGEPEVALAAIHALGSAGHLELIAPSLFPEDARRRASAVFFVAGQSPSPEEHPALAEFLTEDADADAQRALLESIGKSGTARWAGVVMRLQAARRSDLDRLLPTAMAKISDLRFVPLLIARLAHREGRNEVREALAALGAPALEALRAALYDRSTEPAVRLHIPRAISRFASQKAADLLVELLSEDVPGAVRYKALRGLGRLVSAGQASVETPRILPLVQLSLEQYTRLELCLGVLETRSGPRPLSGLLFLGLLLDKRNQALERAIRLLQLLHPREDLRRVYYALSSGDAHNRVAAAEILEVTSLGYDENLRSLLRNVAEPRREVDSLQGYAAALAIEMPDETVVLTQLMADADPLVSSLAASYAIELDHEDLTDDIQAAMQKNGWLAEHAQDATR